MKITYTPNDGEAREFIFRPGELSNIEAELIEIQGGELWATYEDFGRHFMNGGMRAYRAALWICLRRVNPKIKFMDVSFRVDEIDVDLEQEERDRIQAAIEGDQDLDDDQREAMIDLLEEGGPSDQQLIRSLANHPGPEFIEGAVAEPVGKDSESVSTTSST